LFVLKTRQPFTFAARLTRNPTNTKLRPSLASSLLETRGCPRERAFNVQDIFGQIPFFIRDEVELTARHVVIACGEPLSEFVQG